MSPKYIRKAPKYKWTYFFLSSLTGYIVQNQPILGQNPMPANYQTTGNAYSAQAPLYSQQPVPPYNQAPMPVGSGGVTYGSDYNQQENEVPPAYDSGYPTKWAIMCLKIRWLWN